MDFSQQKLRKEDWESMEVPPDPQELEILNMIRDYGRGSGRVVPRTTSLFTFMRLFQGCASDHAVQGMHTHLFTSYFAQVIRRKVRKTRKGDLRLSEPVEPSPPKQALKKADLIRMQNTEARIQDASDELYECLLLETLFNAFLARDQARTEMTYTLSHLLALDVKHANIYVLEYCRTNLAALTDVVSVVDVVLCADRCIEQNALLSKTRPLDLYDHQKSLTDTVNQVSDPKVILYQAPTGTGKTLSPVALAQKHPLIFVCAAKHVGLQLAKACVGTGLPIGIAFGCESPSDVRLHYYAAKDYVRNFRSGGIFRVDHDVGDKVQMIISDVASYTHAMNYLVAFKPADKIVLYWDEPTISLDYNSHEFHPIIQTIWEQNTVEHIVLSSATLPSQEELAPFIASLRRKHPGLRSFSINSSECARTIPIIGPDGRDMLPHAVYSSHLKASVCAEHCKKCPTVTRHLGLTGIGEFMLAADKHVPEASRLAEVFPSLVDITATSLKNHYLDLFDMLEDHWDDVRSELSNLPPRYASTVRITTLDAHTITSGPAIYLCNDPELIARYCIQSAKIPNDVLAKLLERLTHNERSRAEITKLSQTVDGGQQKTGSSEKKDSRKESKLLDQMKDSSAKHALEKINRLEAGLKNASLDEMYVPNTPEHMHRYLKAQVAGAFTCDLPEDAVRQIAQLQVDSVWKILILMGIGAFVEGMDRDYTNIMRKLAYEQRLFCIIASTDYIYGTNYQFCHGYIGKDLVDVTCEKMIQALGRVGRGNSNAGYSVRLRNASDIDKVFLPARRKPEVDNMNRLFRC